MTGMLTRRDLLKVLEYCPATGLFKWRATRGRAKAGAVAGCVRGDGYVMIRIRGRLYYGHRLAWLCMTGAWPTNEIDHIDLNPTNNRWNNLRAATCSQNQANRNKRANNTSGLKGVVWHKQSEKWLARLVHNGKMTCVGYFDTKEQAAAAYADVVKQICGEFARAEGIAA
jgi:hypothetical protein